jgi:hypothetical protein
MRYGRRHIVAAALSIVSFGHPTGHAQTDLEMRAVSVLASQFETIAYARANLYSNSITVQGNSIESEDNLKLPFLELIEAIKTLGPDTAKDLENSYGSVLVGAKDFTPPKGLGAVGSRKCYVGISKNGTQPNIELDFRGVMHESIEGRQVWTWSLSPSEGDSERRKLYAAQIDGSYLVLANNLQDFEEVVRGLTASASPMPARINGSDWETLSEHNYWVYRLIRRSGVISADAAGINGLAPDVIELMFLADVDTRRGFLRVFSSDKSMKTTPRVPLNAELNLLHPVGAGIWQTTVAMSKDETGYDTLFRVFYSLGFGAVL